MTSLSRTRRCLVALATLGALGILTGPGATADPADPATPAAVPQTSDGVPGLRVDLRAPRAVGPDSRSGRVRSTTVARTVAPGLVYRRWSERDARGTYRVHVLSFRYDDPRLVLDAATGGSLTTTRPLSRLLAGERAVAGVNGDFYDITDTGAPFGVNVPRNGPLLGGSVDRWYMSLYLDRAGVPQIGRLPLTARLAEWPLLPLAGVNHPEVPRHGVVAYTPRWGRLDGAAVAGGPGMHRVVVVRDGKVATNSTRLPDSRVDGTVLIGRGLSAQQMRLMRPGMPATLTTEVEGRPRLVVSGNVKLVEDGVARQVDDREAQPRTAVGIDHTGKRLLLVVVDGRSQRSRGVTYQELADLLVRQGADAGVNLDGGGSSTMVARVAGKRRVLNDPSDGFQRSIPVGLAVRVRR